MYSWYCSSSNKNAELIVLDVDNQPYYIANLVCRFFYGKSYFMYKNYIWQQQHHVQFLFRRHLSVGEIIEESNIICLFVYEKFIIKSI